MASKKELALGALSSGGIAKPFVLHWAVKPQGTPVVATDVASDTAISSTPVSEDTAILSTSISEDTAILSTPVAEDTAISILGQALASLFPHGETIGPTQNSAGSSELADTTWS
jgi:hypothetical protein